MNFISFIIGNKFGKSEIFEYNFTADFFTPFAFKNAKAAGNIRVNGGQPPKTIFLSHIHIRNSA